MLRHRLKQITKKTLRLTGLYNILWRFIPNGVYVFNYHRIGDKNTCEFDREVFSCTAEGFDQQCQFIKANFKVISSEELISIRKEGKCESNKYALITFDDGYIDNYSEAFPILKKYNIPATFYVATNFVNNDLIPWWDEIAYILRKSPGMSYQLPTQSITYELKSNEIESVISRVIYDAKRLQSVTVIEVLEDIRSTFSSYLDDFKNQKHNLFMNWEQLIEMSSSGMKIGSHTLSHQMLSQLSDVSQEHELKHSKKIIEDNLTGKIESVVYPVGRKHCYTERTCQLAALSGYTFGFNNEPGRITNTSNPHDLNRYCIGSNDIVELKLTVLFHL